MDFLIFFKYNLSNKISYLYNLREFTFTRQIYQFHI